MRFCSVWHVGVDIRELDVGWYRQRVGYCPQEPILFDRRYVWKMLRYPTIQ